MAENPKWTEPSSIAAMAGALITVMSLVWAAATITAASTALSGNFEAFKRDVSSQISAVQSQIASLPTQSVRLDNLEHSMADARRDINSQGADIATLRQAQAVMAATMDTTRRDVQALQDAANGRLPGTRR